MAKDPAFLFYPGDWQGGTSTFSRFLKGCYLDVLIAQFNSGHLSLEEIKTVLGSDFGQSWPTLQKKFKKDTVGLFFNEKLHTEIVKRQEYSKSRADNRRGKTHVTDMNNISNTHVPHMENGDVNEDLIKNKKESKKDFLEPDTPGDEIFFPIDTPAMRNLWAAWKAARWKNHEVTYAMYGEQAALKELEGLNFHQARSAIQKAIAGNWRNLYPEKSNGQGKSAHDSKSRIDEIIQNRHGPG